MFSYPTIADFITQFTRDFPFGTDPSVSVLQSDISNAMAFASVTFNPNLWDTQAAFSLGYLLLTAHFMCLNLRASSQGINGQMNWVQNSKSVNNVAEQFTIPQRIIDNPDLMMLTKTQYGGLYLQFVIPLLSGQCFTVAGRTKP